MKITMNWKNLHCYLHFSYEEAYEVMNSLQESLKALDTTKEPEWFVGFNLPPMDNGSAGTSIIVAKQEN